MASGQQNHCWGKIAPAFPRTTRLFAAAVRFATNRREQKRAGGHEVDAASMGPAAESCSGKDSPAPWPLTALRYGAAVAVW